MSSLKNFLNLILKLTAQNQDFYDLFFVFALLLLVLGVAVLIYAPAEAGLAIFAAAIIFVFIGLLGRIDRNKIEKKIEKL